jgi:rSAM/selenodomain-associated transferase 2
MHADTYASAPPLISIIIPTLNEENHIAQVLRTTAQRCAIPDATEIIVVDGGSSDATMARARQCTAELQNNGMTLHILSGPKGRAWQMNIGAEHARGDILLFLHADTLLPRHFDRHIRTALAAEPLTLGAFNLKINTDTQVMKWICWWANVRSRVFALPYGDQALFVQRSDFMRLGMFPAMEIMEDFAFVRKFKRSGGNISVLSDKVITSARRWQKRGCLFTTMCNQIMILGYYLHIPTRHLARWYRR